MSTPGALAGLHTFDGLNIDYETAYRDNRFKTACIQTAISLLPPASRVLDVGCGTGIPVSAMLAAAGLHVTGIDISPKMVALAQSRVEAGAFLVTDMLTYTPPPHTFAGVFIIFSHLQLSYADFHAAIYKFASALEPDGILALGQMPGDAYVRREDDWDETRTWVEDYDAPFMGGMIPTLMLSARGQRELLTSMGLEVVSETVDFFQPKGEKCEPEEQQYIVARRVGGRPVALPKPLPRAKEEVSG